MAYAIWIVVVNAFNPQLLSKYTKYFFDSVDSSFFERGLHLLHYWSLFSASPL